MPVFIEIFLFHLSRFSIIYYKFLHFIYTFTLFLYIYLDKFPEIFRNRSPPRKLFHLQHPSNTILHWVNQRKEGGNETRLFPRNNPMILRINAPASDPPVIRKRTSKRGGEREDWVAAIKGEGGLPFRLFACLELGHGIVGAMLGQPRNFKNGPFSRPSPLPSQWRRSIEGGSTRNWLEMPIYRNAIYLCALCGKGEWNIRVSFFFFFGTKYEMFEVWLVREIRSALSASYYSKIVRAYLCKIFLVFISFCGGENFLMRGTI